MKMRIIIVFCLSTALLTAVCMSAPTAETKKPEMNIRDHYTLGVYWPWERTPTAAAKANLELWKFTEKTLRSLKEDFNVNLVWIINIELVDVAKFCDIADKYHIKVAPSIIPIVNLYNWGIPSVDHLKGAVSATVDSIGGKNALVAYGLTDEPRRVHTKQMELFRKELKAFDPARDSIMVTVTDSLESYAHQTNFPVLCFDIYPYGGDLSPHLPNPASSSQAYYRNILGALQNETAKTGKQLWSMSQVYGQFWGPWWYDENMNVVLEPGTYHHWRTPTAAEIRWQIWEGVRTGLKGIVFFVLFPEPNDWDGKDEAPKGMAAEAAQAKEQKLPVLNRQVRTGSGTALLYNNGAPTAQIKGMGGAYGKLAGIDDLLVSLEVADFPVAFVDDTFTAATFVSSKNTAYRYVVVVNDNLEESRQKKVIFLPHVKKVYDVITQKELILTKETSENLVSSTLTLEPGDGTVLRIEFAKSGSGFILFDEDFSIATMGLRTSNIIRQPILRNFGTGWDWVVQKAKDLPAEIKGTLTIPNISAVGSAFEGLMVSQEKFDVYLNVDGNFKKSEPESIIMDWVGNEGKRGRLRSNNYYLPAHIPEGAKDIEILIPDGIMVNRVLLWAIPKAN